MNLKEVLHFADQIVFEKTGQHLDDLQEAVLKGTLQRETYKQIAKDFDCSESRARNAGSQLWQILSKELGEDVSKSNFISAIKRFQISNSSNFAYNVSGNFNICGQGRHPPDIPKSHRQNQETSHTKQTKTLHHDLSQKPDLADFYGRSSELDTLKTWILQERCRLISLTGISGIGKTQLVVKLLPYLQEHFEYILWYNADQDSTFTEFQADLFALFDPSLQDSFIPPHGKPLKSLIKPLQKHRCLVVLDDIHHLFCRGELAGKYKPELEEYRASRGDDLTESLMCKALGLLNREKDCRLLIGLLTSMRGVSALEVSFCVLEFPKSAFTNLLFFFNSFDSNPCLASLSTASSPREIPGFF